MTLSVFKYVLIQPPESRTTTTHVDTAAAAAAAGGGGGGGYTVTTSSCLYTQTLLPTTNMIDSASNNEVICIHMNKYSGHIYIALEPHHTTHHSKDEDEEEEGGSKDSICSLTYCYIHSVYTERFDNLSRVIRRLSVLSAHNTEDLHHRLPELALAADSQVDYDPYHVPNYPHNPSSHSTHTGNVDGEGYEGYYDEDDYNTSDMAQYNTAISSTTTTSRRASASMRSSIRSSIRSSVRKEDDLLSNMIRKSVLMLPSTSARLQRGQSATSLNRSSVRLSSSSPSSATRTPRQQQQRQQHRLSSRSSERLAPLTTTRRALQSVREDSSSSTPRSYTDTSTTVPTSIDQGDSTYLSHLTRRQLPLDTPTESTTTAFPYSQQRREEAEMSAIRLSVRSGVTTGGISSLGSGSRVSIRGVDVGVRQSIRGSMRNYGGGSGV